MQVKTYSGAWIYRSTDPDTAILQAVFLFDGMQSGKRQAVAEVDDTQKVRIVEARLAFHGPLRMASLEIGWIERQNRRTLMSGVAPQDFIGEIVHRSPVVIGHSEIHIYTETMSNGGWSPERRIVIAKDLPQGMDLVGRLVFDEDMRQAIYSGGARIELGANLDILCGVENR